MTDTTLEAENKRLREALKKYQADQCEGLCSEYPQMTAEQADCAGCLARITLKMGEGDD